MDDRQLLEAAAKAAGIEGEWERDPNYLTERLAFMVPYNNQNMMSAFEWNPLVDDGDALRLAVKLRMIVSLADCCCCAVVDWAGNEDDNEIRVRFSEDFDDRECADAQSATRRAIVKAAAALGTGAQEKS